MTIKTGDFIEASPKDRDTLRRVGIVGEVSTYSDATYFKAVVLAADPDTGEFFNLGQSSYSLADEGTEWRRLTTDGLPSAADLDAQVEQGVVPIS